MRLSFKTRREISVVIAAISVCVWILLLFNPGHIMTIEHCAVSDAGPSAASLQMLLKMNPISSKLLGWGLMVAAMMLPKLILPIQDIYARSLKRNRFRLALLFVLGYMAAWMAVGLVIVMLILLLHLVLPASYLPAIILAIIAIIWQFSPVKQRCLNHGHDHWTLSAFGWAASRSALRYGLTHGAWCVGSGWALMLLPMLLPAGHNLAMIIVTFIMLSEHLEHPKVPRWRIDLRARLFRFVLAQAQIKLKQVSVSN